MKKIITCFIMAFMMMGTYIPVLASEGINVYVNCEKVNYDVQPQTINGRVMVPVRSTFSALGADVVYYKDLGVITAEKDNNQIIMLLDQKRIAVIDVSTDKVKKFVDSDVAPTVINGRTLIPLRAVSDCFDCDITWNNQTKAVFITYGEDLTTGGKGKSTKDAIKFNIVVNGISKDITNAAKAQMIGYDIMVEAKPVLEEFGAFVLWDEETKTLKAYRKDDSVLEIKYDGSNTLQRGFIGSSVVTKMQATVAPKLVDGVPMVYYHDVARLVGGISHYVADTKTCTIVEEGENQTSSEFSNANLNNNSDRSDAYTKKESVSTKDNSARENRNELKNQQKIENKNAASQDKDTSIKTTKVLKKDEGWIDVTNKEASQKTNSEPKHKVLRKGEGWVYE